ncbi:MAG: FAD binding domain-containing protein [Ignavibacteria bacterium]|nr:FAD binding domain-containing protein [Ignavibacteria bacterium]
MKTRINFILNNDLVDIEINPATVLLDFIRNERLKGTKEGCKEGDCGACTVLTGELKNDTVSYRSVNSCLLPVGNISGKHIVTIEGLNQDGVLLNPLQKAFVDEGATQCGFCTPGFIISLTGYFLNLANMNSTGVLESLDGNICRCTGHNSIIRAAQKVSDKFTSGNKIITQSNLAEMKIIPEYFLTIQDRLQKLSQNGEGNNSDSKSYGYFVGGGTDLFVQRPDEMINSEIKLLYNDKDLFGIDIKDGYCIIGSNATVTDLRECEILKKYFPEFDGFMNLFGSTPIRNNATVGGNLNNASPIGDMTIFFLSLNSVVTLTDGISERDVFLKDFYLSYKKTDRLKNEYMKCLKFKLPDENYFYNFEKVSKRTYLDIASVNSSVFLKTENNYITEIYLSAGGVSAIPLFLSKTCEMLTGTELSPDNIKEAVLIAQKEISPISDARGSEDYKRLLLTRLIYAHFLVLFPEIFKTEDTYERL